MNSRLRSFLVLLTIALPLASCTDSDHLTGPVIEPTVPTALLRAAHLSPDAPAVDVWVDGAVVLSGVTFPAVSDYLEVTAGSHRIQVTPTGVSSPIVIDATLNLIANRAYTAAATGLLGAGDLQPLPVEDSRIPEPGMANVRVVHTSPDAPRVDIWVTNGPQLFTNVAFREKTNYRPVAPGTYDLEVRVAGTDTVALRIPGVNLSAGRNYSVYAIGQLSNASLSVLSSIDL